LGAEKHLDRSRVAIWETTDTHDSGDDRFSGSRGRVRHQCQPSGTAAGDFAAVAARADILLKPARKALEIKGVSSTKLTRTTRAAHTPLRSQIPVQTHFERGSVKSGFFAFDTVVHCGTSASGQFCKTLTGTDVYSGWIEERPLLNAVRNEVSATAGTGGSFEYQERAQKRSF
jgi:hypothetical protein